MAAVNPTGENASMATTTSTTERWSGGVHLVLDCKLDAAWRLQSDFLGLTAWAPTVSECRHEDGPLNAVGCLRFCQGSGTTWVHERLLELHHDNHYMSYVMEDNHFVFPHGFQGYVAKVHMGEAGEGKTWVKWTYEVDPVQTQTRDSLTSFMTGFYTQNLIYLETGAKKLMSSALSGGGVEPQQVSSGPNGGGTDAQLTHSAASDAAPARAH